MTDDERHILEAMLGDLVRLAREPGPGPLADEPLTAEEMAKLLGSIGQWQPTDAPLDRDLPFPTENPLD